VGLRKWYRLRKVRHNNLMQRHTELKDNYNELADRHDKLIEEHNNVCKQFSIMLIEEAWLEEEIEKEDGRGELQIHD